MNYNDIKNHKIFGSIFWKLFSLFIIIFLLFSAIYFYIFTYNSEMYFQETIQKLNSNVAEHISKFNEIYRENGEINDTVVKDLFHNVMVVNPSIEVYLLNQEGEILSYYAPDKVIKIENVPLTPIKEFISDPEKFITGIDPKNTDSKKPFSAAKIYNNGDFAGYIYVVLNGEEYQNVVQLLDKSYYIRMTLTLMIAVLIAALIIGFVSLKMVSAKVKKFVHVINDFRRGNKDARINFESSGELKIFADSFNNMADTINHQIEKISEMDLQRRELIANISHDLRTPMASIKGFAETILIKQDVITQEQNEKYLKVIIQNTEKLMKLISELMELSQLEAREKVPEIEMFSIKELVHDVCLKNKVFAESKKIQLRMNFEDDIPLVKADLAMMERVMQNLLENGIKYTPEGGIVNIRLKGEDNKVKIDVEDSGPGIDENDLPYIFDRFTKSTAVDSKHTESHGLGLSIVKRILDLHEIEIKAYSSKDNGSRFSFNLPVTNPE